MMRSSWDVLWPLVGFALIWVGVDRISAGRTTIAVAALVIGAGAVVWGAWRLKAEWDHGRGRGGT